MHSFRSYPRERIAKSCGFTVVELLLVIAIVAILAALLLPASRGHGDKAPTAACMINLKQIAIAEIIWADDHGGKFPAQVSTNIGGTMEFLSEGKLNLHFLALRTNLSSQLTVLHCPADKRVSTTNVTGLMNTNISYFASANAGVSNSNWFLAGDRNLVSKGAATKPGLLSLATNSVLGWTKEMHSRSSSKPRGVIAFADGHAQSSYEDGLVSLVRNLGSQTNQLMFP